eukprot:2721838-Amphidinium_carterae.1
MQNVMEMFFPNAQVQLRRIRPKEVQPIVREKTTPRDISDTLPAMVSGSGPKKRPAAAVAEVQEISDNDANNDSDTSHSPGLVGFDHIYLRSHQDRGEHCSIYVLRCGQAAALHTYSRDNYNGFVFHVTTNYTLHVVADHLRKLYHCQAAQVHFHSSHCTDIPHNTTLSAQTPSLAFRIVRGDTTGQGAGSSSAARSHTAAAQPRVSQHINEPGHRSESLRLRRMSSRNRHDNQCYVLHLQKGQQIAHREAVKKRLANYLHVAAARLEFLQKKNDEQGVEHFAPADEIVEVAKILYFIVLPRQTEERRRTDEHMRVAGSEEDGDEAEVDGEEEQEHERDTIGEAIERSEPTPEPTIISNVPRRADTIHTGQRDPPGAYDRRVRREAQYGQNEENNRPPERPMSESSRGPGRDANARGIEDRMHDRSRADHAREH